MTSIPNVRSEASTRTQHLVVKPRKAIDRIHEGVASSPAFAGIGDRFRQMAARCFDEESTKHTCLAVTSSVYGEGRSTIALGLALATAQNLGSEVLLLETELQRPQLAEDLGLDSSIGLSQYIYGDAALEAVVQPTRVPNLWLLGAGHPVANPGPLIRSMRFRALINTLRGLYAAVIVDVPPVLASPHAAVIIRQADSVVVVARAGRTHVADVENSMRAIGKERMSGVVINGADTWLPRWLAHLLGDPMLGVE